MMQRQLTYGYVASRKQLGKQPLFCEQGPEMCDNITADDLENRKYILRNPVHQSTQYAPSLSENKINTFRGELSNTGTCHSEGGWPHDVHAYDPEATQRYRRRVEKEEAYIDCVRRAAPAVEHYLMQNNAIDMYESYYADIPPQPQSDKFSVRTVNIYKEFLAPCRRVSSIAWQTEKPGLLFAVAYLDVNFNREPKAPIKSAIWDINRNGEPQMLIKPTSPLLDLQFGLRDSFLLVGGLMNGQVALWDRRRGKEHISISPPHMSHRDMVRSVLFANSKSGAEFFSGSADGLVKWWDLRNLNAPTDEIMIDYLENPSDVQSMPKALAVSVLEYEHQLPSRFMLGTETGTIISGNKKAKKAIERLTVKYEAHNGPVLSLERNPGFMKIFLSVGDWTLRVWSEDTHHSSIFWSPTLRHKITCGIWSKYRSSLILLSQTNGMISLWDLLRRQHEPILSMQVCQDPLLRMKMHHNGSLVACGSQKGNVYLLELSHSLSAMSKDEKRVLTSMFEREAHREHMLEARVREIKLKLKMADESRPDAREEEVDPTIGDKDLHDATAEYIATIKKELQAIY